MPACPVVIRSCVSCAALIALPRDTEPPCLVACPSCGELQRSGELRVEGTWDDPHAPPPYDEWITARPPGKVSEAEVAEYKKKKQ